MSRHESTLRSSRASKKTALKPKMPYSEFPLSPHPSGKWQKKIRGKIHYFGAWARRVNGKLERIDGDGWREALEEYKAVADDLHAGRTPRPNRDGLQIKELCNHFLTAKTRKVDARELTERMFTEGCRTGFAIKRPWCPSYGKLNPVERRGAWQVVRLH